MQQSTKHSHSVVTMSSLLRFCCTVILLFALLFSFVSANFPNHSTATAANSNPYKILNVAKNASDEEIRRSYRTLCLKYHPDKNVHLSAAERDSAEDRFKKVQTANASIGSAQARRTFDSQQSLFGGAAAAAAGFHPSSQGSSSQTEFERAFAQAFRARPGAQFGGRTSPFYGFSPSDVFSRGQTRTGTAAGLLASMPSIFLQNVPVSLQDLYAGKRGIEITLNDGIWQRYTAAFRGGAAYIVLYQAALYAIPTLRVSRWFAVLFAGVIFHNQIPRPTITRYTVDLKSGYKQGTKLIFRNAEPGLQVVFVLVQGEKDDHYTLIGNDLHLTVPISLEECKEGCTIDIEPLGGASEPTIEADVAPGLIERSGQTMTIVGKGWPIRKKGGHGDLVIHFRLTNSRRRQKSKARRQKRQEKAKRHFWQRKC